MTKGRIALFVVAILAVGISLYMAFKPAPKVASEQPVPVEGAVVAQAEKFSVKVRKLAEKRSLRSLNRISVEPDTPIMGMSVKSLRAFSPEGLKIESMTNTKKAPEEYNCKIVNSAGQKGVMSLYSKDRKRWYFIGFATIGAHGDK